MRSMMLIIAALVISAGQAFAADDGRPTGDTLKLAALEAITPEATEPDTRTRVALMCFKTGERISGLNKICYYNCAGSEAAITIKSHQLCPLSINR